MPAAKPPPGDWFDDPITEVYPLQPMRLYVQIALANARGGFASRAQSMRTQRDDAWRNYRASIKGFENSDPRRITKAAWLNAWTQMVATVESSSSKVRSHGDEARARREWMDVSKRDFYLPESKYAWALNLIVQGEFDIAAETTHTLYIIIEMREFNWIEVNGRRVRNTMANAYLSAAVHARQFVKPGSRLKLIAANARALVSKKE